MLVSHASCARSIASYDTREENTGVGLGDVLKEFHDYITGPADSENEADNGSDAERPLLDNDSAHEDESLHKAFIRRRTMTVHPLLFQPTAIARSLLGTTSKVHVCPARPSCVQATGTAQWSQIQGWSSE